MYCLNLINLIQLKHIYLNKFYIESTTEKNKQVLKSDV